MRKQSVSISVQKNKKSKDSFYGRGSRAQKSWLGLPRRAYSRILIGVCLPIPLWLVSVLLEEIFPLLAAACVLLLAIYYFPPMLLATLTPFGESLRAQNDFILWPSKLGVLWCAFVYAILLAAPAVHERWKTRQCDRTKQLTTTDSKRYTIRSLFALTIIAAFSFLLVRNRREVVMWGVSTMPILQLAVPDTANAAYESYLKELSLESDAAVSQALAKMLRGQRPERRYALEYLYHLPPQAAARHVPDLIRTIGDDNYPQLVDHACDHLIRIAPRVRPHVPKLLELAESCEHDWHRFTIEYVLTAVGDFRPEVVSVINEIRGLRIYKQVHPNTGLHPNTGTHYINASHLSDRLH